MRLERLAPAVFVGGNRPLLSRMERCRASPDEGPVGASTGCLRSGASLLIDGFRAAVGTMPVASVEADGQLPGAAIGVRTGLDMSPFVSAASIKRSVLPSPRVSQWRYQRTNRVSSIGEVRRF